MTQLIYPKGYIAVGASDLIDVTNIKISTKNNGKQVHTLKQEGAGVVKGNTETTITYDAVISELGPEADYFKMVAKGTIKQLRIKVPAATYTVTGMYTSTDIDIPEGDAIKQSLEFIGKLDV